LNIEERRMTRKTALVTGASRGIGKAAAIHLARAGFDVALAARTATEGEAREHSSTVQRSDMTPLPGSLASTQALVEAEGAQALPVVADLLDQASLGVAVTTVLQRWGHIDLLLNNARYVGPGHMDRLLDTPIPLLQDHLNANVIAPLILCKLVLPSMIEHGGGQIVNMSSMSAYSTPRKAAGDGGWGLGYGITKAAMHRIAGILAVETEGTGVQVINIDPGSIATERIAQDMGSFGFSGGAPADVIGAVLAWLGTHPDEAKQFNGETIPA